MTTNPFVTLPSHDPSMLARTPDEIATILSSRESPVIDAVIKDLIEQHFAGLIDERRTRAVIAAMLTESGIIEQTVFGSAVRIEMLDDVMDNTRLRVIEKITGDDAAKHFGLPHQRTASACGWLRKHARNVVIQQIRDVQRAYNRRGSLYDPLDALSPDSGLDVSYEDYSSFDDAFGFKDMSVDNHLKKVHGLRGKPRSRGSVEELLKFFDVPMAIRPLRYKERDSMLAELKEDQFLAYRSLETFAAITWGVGDVEEALRRDIDDSYLALWDDYEQTNAEALLSANPLSAHAIAVYAVEPFQRPSKRPTATMRRAVGRIVKPLEWTRLSSAMVDAWVDTQCDPYSDYSATVNESSLESIEKGHLVSRSRYDTLMTRVIAYPNSPLGDTLEKVEESLTQYGIKYLECRDLQFIAEYSADNSVELEPAREKVNA